MSILSSSTNQKALALGAIAGIRAMTAPALLSNHFHHSPTIFLEGTKLGYLQKSGVATGTKLLAVLEMLGDKIPNVPDRIKPIELLPRVVSGGLVGATLAEANGESRITGGLLGVVGALASSYVFFFLRTRLVKITGLPDATFALMEDALALKAGSAILK
ncbi:DUF4126 family protein [Rufibacter immobilis]|nr:DUF4126 family protein [Rufibacter immobilis]